MLLPDLLTDVLIFGALLLGALADGAIPATHGAASLLSVGAALYIASQEAAAWMERRKVWTQESLWTSLSLCAAGFAYYWWRNQSDLSLIALSIALMLSSLMVAIGIIAGIGAILRGERTAIIGLAASIFGALALGALGGACIVALGQPNSSLPIAWKIGVVALSFVLWKAREKARPPMQNTPEATSAPVEEKPVTNIYGIKAAPARAAPPGASTSHRALIPQRGTVFDRLGPVLILGLGLLAIAVSNSKLAAPIVPRAIATQGTPVQAEPPATTAPEGLDSGPSAP